MNFLRILFLVSITTAQYLKCSSTKCYQFYVEHASFYDAESECRSIRGHLVSIHSLEENDFIASIGEIIHQKTKFEIYWIGAQLWQSKWIWTDGTPFNYTNWKSDEQKEEFGVQEYSTGAWTSHLFQRYPFICSAPSVTPSVVPTTLRTTLIPTTSITTQDPLHGCDSGWTYFETTGFCYKVYNHASWESAEAQCVSNNSHLASIHSDAENLFVNILSAGGLGNPGWNDLVWIGMKYVNQTWVWTDATNADFFKWAPTQPDYLDHEFCVLTVADKMKNGYFQDWNNFPCYNVMRAFVCKKAPSTLRTTLIPTTSQIITKIPPTRCDPEWTYFETTGFCYKVYNHASWESAESQCVSNNSHLTSIHSDAENLFVNNLSAGGIENPGWNDLVWIGMKYVNETWIWTDGTNAEFFKWAPTQPDYLDHEFCVLTVPDKMKNGYFQDWNNFPCYNLMRAFVCKKASNN